ncbi:MAG: PEP-CTERM sorting domain-containing protein [Fuerstiella sp.]
MRYSAAARLVPGIAAAILLFPLPAVMGGIITTLDFTDSHWSISLTGTGSGTFSNQSSATASTITATKTGSAGGARIVVDLIGSISTVGFQNIRLAMDGAASNMEWNGDLTGGVSSSDGFRVLGAGVDINGNAANDLSGTLAETDFFNGPASFPNANLSGDFLFDNSIANSSLSDLQFILQVNANNEQISLSNVRLLGDAITTAVPEPSSLALFGLLSTGTLFAQAMKRRRFQPQSPEENTR